MPGTPICSLRIQQPTSTTISFIVSTRPPLDTWHARLLHYCLLLVRLIIGSFVFLALWTEWELLSSENGVTFPLPLWIRGSIPGQTASMIAVSIQAKYLIPVAIAVLWVIVRRGYTGAFTTIALQM